MRHVFWESVRWPCSSRRVGAVVESSNLITRPPRPPTETPIVGDYTQKAGTCCHLLDNRIAQHRSNCPYEMWGGWATEIWIQPRTKLKTNLYIKADKRNIRFVTISIGYRNIAFYEHVDDKIAGQILKCLEKVKFNRKWGSMIRQ